MPKNDDRGYYERRAEKELSMAEATGNRNACASHYELANRYLELAFQDEADGGPEKAPKPKASNQVRVPKQRVLHRCRTPGAPTPAAHGVPDLASNARVVWQSAYRPARTA